MEAKPLLWAISMGHIHGLPQQSGRAQVNLPMAINMGGHTPLQRAITTAINAKGSPLKKDGPGLVVIPPEVIQELVDLAPSAQIVYVESEPTKTKKHTPKQKADWFFSDNLFAGFNQKFYRFDEGAKILGIVRGRIPDLSAFAEWREAGDRKPLAVNVGAVMAEYKVFKTPKVDVDSLEVAKATPDLFKQVSLRDKL